MRFSIQRPSEQTLLLHEDANYLPAFVLMGVAMFLVFFSAPLFKASLFLGLMLFGSLGLASLAAFLVERELSCTLDKGTGTILYKRGGAFDTQYDRQETQYAWADIQALIVKWHIQRRGDAFQLRLVLKSGKQLDLSAASLKFSEVQGLASQIHQFIGTEIPLQNVD